MIDKQNISVNELEILGQFLKDYLQRFEVYKMEFAFDKGSYVFAGKTRNTNSIPWMGESVDLTPLLEKLEIPEYISIGGDFVIGYDYAAIDGAPELLKNQVGLSIFDTANHGYEAFFLAGHLRTILLNILDLHVRSFSQVDNDLFVQINEHLKGPVTQELVHNTNPVRAHRTKGAVGLHGQFHCENGDFNFVCTGFPVFYYSSHQETFYFLEPYSGPPLGYFSNREAFYKPYVPHTLRLHPGDYLILASDGCYETELWEEGQAKARRTKNPVRRYRYAANEDLDFMHRFDAVREGNRGHEFIDDPAIQTFCSFLEVHMNADKDPETIVGDCLTQLRGIKDYNFDDKSLIVAHAPKK